MNCMWCRFYNAFEEIHLTYTLKVQALKLLTITDDLKKHPVLVCVSLGDIFDRRYSVAEIT